MFTFFSFLFLRVDAVQDPGELFEVTRRRVPGADSSVSFTRPEYEALCRETSVFVDVVAMFRGIETRIEGRPVSSTLVTGNFFQVLGVQATLGRTRTPVTTSRLLAGPSCSVTEVGPNCSQAIRR